MKLFDKTRVKVHINGGKLKLDAKTEAKRWILDLQVALVANNVYACGDAIVSNFEQIEARQNGIEEIKLGISVPEQVIEFFGLSDHTAPALRLGKVTISDLKMSYGGETYLDFKADTECNRAIHDFIRDYAFTTLWAEFAPSQTTLPLAAPAPPKVESAKGPIQ